MLVTIKSNLILQVFYLFATANFADFKAFRRVVEVLELLVYDYLKEVEFRKVEEQVLLVWPQSLEEVKPWHIVKCILLLSIQRVAFRFKIADIFRLYFQNTIYLHIS